MFCIRCVLCLIGLFLSTPILAQENVTGYVEPGISVSYNVATNYSHNFQLSQRSYLYDESFEYRSRQLDLAHFSKLKIAFDQSIALGIQYRFRNVFEEDKENELRFTQQYNITKKWGGLRLGNRLRAEQRITLSLTTHRFRYRIALDLPLNGERLDVGEAFFVASVESLLSAAQSNKPQFDQRLSANIGWLLNLDIKFEVGAEYRVEDYTQNTQNVLFLLTSLDLDL